MLNIVRNFIADESGAAGVEYGLLVALIAAVMLIPSEIAHHSDMISPTVPR
jgi:Flp pilus assembly pilin Flp